MPKPLTVYSWQDDRTQARRYCAAASVAALLRITGYPSRRWLFNLGEPGSDAPERAAALAEPGVVFARPLYGQGDLQRVEGR